MPRGVKNPLTELFDRHTSDRTKLIMLLGNKCKNPECLVPGGCTDIRCLQLDHINGGGVRQMKYLKGCNNMYRYYLKHIVEACNDLQVLCANCNWTKRYGNRHEYGGTKSMFLT